MLCLEIRLVKECGTILEINIDHLFPFGMIHYTKFRGSIEWKLDTLLTHLIGWYTWQWCIGILYFIGIKFFYTFKCISDIVLLPTWNFWLSCQTWQAEYIAINLASAIKTHSLHAIVTCITTFMDQKHMLSLTHTLASECCRSIKNIIRFEWAINRILITISW